MAAQTISAESCKNWEKSGKREFLSICKSEVTSSVSKNGTLATPTLVRALHDVSWHVLRGALSKDQAASAFLDIADLSPDLPSLLADVLSIIGNT